MSLINGRADDMLIIRGVNVYPTQVEAALLELSDLTPNYRIVVSRSGTLDEAEVEVEVSEAFLREVGTDSLSRSSTMCASCALRWSAACARRSAARFRLFSRRPAPFRAPRAASSNACWISARWPEAPGPWSVGSGILIV